MALNVYQLVFCIACVRGVRVTTSVGQLDGVSSFLANGKQVFSFLGVPYAEQLMEEDRFNEPKPVKQWTEVRSATQYSSPCAQLVSFAGSVQITGSDDCLYLNIFTTNVSNTSDQAVLVFFHGGAFMFGSGSHYRPEYFLANHDLVFVTVNYRLGPFGFMSTEDDIVPGNNGLKDQVLALRWIRDNIIGFGGDPKKVTISGNSAGAASVHYHFLSQDSRGLFIRGILSSGSALMPWALTEKPLMKAKMLAEACNCSTENTETMVNCLRQRTSQEILSKINPLLMPWESNPFSPFGPVIEKGNKNNSFLTDHPYYLISKGDTFDGDLLVSLTKEEGLYPAASFLSKMDLLKTLDRNLIIISPHLLDFNNTVLFEDREEISEKIKEYYFGKKETSTVTVPKLVGLLSDRLFNADMDLAARMQASVMKSPVFMFMLGYRGNMSLSNLMSKSKTNFGVSHGDDLYYLMMTKYADRLRSQSDQWMINTLVNTWVSFVQRGKPEPREGVIWESIPKDSARTGQLTYLLMKGPQDLVTTRSSDFGNHKFWKSLGLDENEHFKSNFNPKPGHFYVYELLVLCTLLCSMLIFKYLIYY